MSVKVRLSHLLLSPWITTAISVLFSVAIYLLVCGFIVRDYGDGVGLTLSITIPAVITYPFALFGISCYRRIEDQKIELERMNALNKRLFSTIAHDIRGPIASACSVMQAFETEDMSREERRDMIRKLSASFDNLSQFLDDLLEWSRHQLAGDQAVQSVVDIDRLLDRIITLYEPMMTAKSLQLHRDVRTGWLKLDEAGYSLVLRNIIHNAIKFTPEHGVITIEITDRNNVLETRIRDTGVGIDKDYLEMILVSSESVSSKGTNNETGSGFGLQASIQYIRYSGGQVEIESEKGKGTEFRVTLPLG